MTIRPFAIAGPLLLALSGAAFAQGAPGASPAPPPTGAPVATPQPNSTGAPNAVTVSPTGNPADTANTDSSAGGNAGQPSRAVPQGGSGGDR